MVLKNYFENNRNFDNYKEKIIETFSPNETDIEYIFNKYPDIKNDNICSLHVRMGNDMRQLYKENGIKKQTEFYYKMIDHMIKHKNINYFYVMTNDKEYCDEILNIEKYKDIIFKYTNERDFVDLWIISLIKNNIVSPSTLGWWGAYLNKNEDKYIIHNKYDHRNLTYHEWIHI
jgi:O86/O127-antigen biosynthesis alpha-1,2-fucosyltransferase